MILRTQNASGGLKIDIGGPCPKPYINITFWAYFLAPEAEKPVLEWKNSIWVPIWRFLLFWSNSCDPGRLRNLNIPIGILRFLSLPGSHGSLQNSKNLQIHAKIALFHSKTGFSASGAEKNAPERYVYVGFWAGAANVDF